MRKINEADLIILQCPMYWLGLPAIMKGWIDKCFADKVAYDTTNFKWFDDGPLKVRDQLAICNPVTKLAGSETLIRTFCRLFGSTNINFIWAASWQNQQNGMCTQRRLRSAWASLSAQRRLWSDWADAQADLSLRWAHSHFVGFVMRRLNFYCWVYITETSRCWLSKAVKTYSVTVLDGWVRVLRPFDSISVISRRWKGEHGRLCAMKRRLGSGRISPSAGFEPVTPSQER